MPTHIAATLSRNRETSTAALIAAAVREIKQAINESAQLVMATNKTQLDAVIAGLPAQIETAVETALQPVIAAIQSAAEAEGVDLTDEVASLNAIPAAVSSAIATALTPATTTTPPATS